MPHETNAFGGVRGSPGVPGTRSGARETNPKPEHGRDGRRDFSSRAGREALAGGVAKGGTHHASAALEQSRAWQRPRARRGRKKQQTSWTARDVRMAAWTSTRTEKARDVAFSLSVVFPASGSGFFEDYYQPSSRSPSFQLSKTT